MKDGSCPDHEEVNRICFIRIADGEYSHSVDDICAIADYDKEGNLLGIEFPYGIEKRIVVHEKRGEGK